MSKREIVLSGCDGTEYVFFPACCYDGNRFRVLKKEYPPMYDPHEAGVDMPVTITDIPRLEEDGDGKIQVTTGDLSTPCVGVYVRRTGRAILVFTAQSLGGSNIGLAYERGRITLTAPASRDYIYYWPHLYKNDEAYTDWDGEIPCEVVEFDCGDMETFYRIFFENRKIMGMDDTRASVLSAGRQFEIQREKFNGMNWKEADGFYDIDTNGMWQPGWVGGGMAGYALMKLGGPVEQERAVKTLWYLFENQAPETGLFYGFRADRNDGFGTPGTENWVLIRKSADSLYFLFKHFALMNDIPRVFIDGTKKLADTFVAIWERYGQFGQFVDCRSGDMVVGNSTCGAIVPAALISAFRYFGDSRYLNTALESADRMYVRDARSGYTTGGPGEILQCPDSESAFALLESTVLLYEETGDRLWLERSEFMAHLCSSWVVCYNYRFPDGSEFSRLGMKTVGSVFANAQNKHSAPGICTLSGDSLHKLHKWTGNSLYKELIDDISLTISQYMSTRERPIRAWDGSILPSGVICERVNMSDWERVGCVGGVFNGSCWCETSNLLTLAECPGT